MYTNRARIGIPTAEERSFSSDLGSTSFRAPMALADSPEKTPRNAPEGTWADATRELLRWLPVVLPTLLVAVVTIRAVLAKVGHPAATLDDSYIHFQYARAIVEGHPMRYQGGEPVSSGATSQLWPALLAPFYALGFRGHAIMWPAWGLSYVCFGALAYEAYALARGLVSKPMAVAAGAMTLFFGGHVWCAASGMEVIPFAWLLARSARRGSEWCEDARYRTPKGLVELSLLSVAAPLMRPEGALASVLVALAVAGIPRSPTWRSRAAGLLPLAGILVTPLLLLAMTGKTTTSTTQVKLAVGNPYHPFVPTFVANARTLVYTLLNGEVWSVEFLPRGGAKIALAALAAVPLRGIATRKVERSLAVLAFALAMFVPCAYITFLWNRLRYLWPFATGWFVALACLGEALGAAAARVRRSYGVVGPVFGFGVAGMLATRLDWVIDDVAGSASGIDRQHGKVAAFAAEKLPANARIGLNDTGAIAYFGGKKTFDIVGLTTPSEAPYWLGGPASRFEHYERLYTADKGRLPTHFAVYPEWMGCDQILGETLFEATVKDATILGGQTMKLMTADYSRLGSGELPRAPLPETVDTLDVADLESERAHAYELLGALEGEQTVESFPRSDDPDAPEALDGARTMRRNERFVAELRPGASHRLVVRARATPSGDDDVIARVRVGGVEIGTVRAPGTDVFEGAIVVPAAAATGRAVVDVHVEGGTLSVAHYWIGVATGADAR